ncbi:MAG: hypothetical protein ABI168_09400, partial [Ginsengibacter sp.]
VIDISGTEDFCVDKPLVVHLTHSDGSKESFMVNHTYNEQQIEWYKAGAALNIIRKNFAGA